MSVQVQSISTNAWEGRDNNEAIQIPKPTGLTVGDLMIAHIALVDEEVDGVVSGDVETESGWEFVDILNYNNSGTVATFLFYKIADSDDVSATNFTFTQDSGSGKLMSGAIYRIDGHGDPAQIEVAKDDDTGSSTPSFAIGVTPDYADSLLLYLTVGQGNHSSGSATNYAVTTSNPTWSEAYDIYGDGTSYFGAGDGDGLLTGAYASRPETTDTGNATITYTTFSTNFVAMMVVIPPAVNVDITGSTGILTLNGNAGTVTGTANITGSTGVLTLNGNAGTVVTQAPDWSNVDKSAAPSWVNPDKS